MPLDECAELYRNGTTANYRMIHLQRLANPMLPWNPLPKKADGTPDPDHRPNLPVNPYRTLDSSSVNLTAFNGVSRAESDLDIPKQTAEGKNRPWIFGREGQAYVANMHAGKQAWYFRSLEARFCSPAESGRLQPDSAKCGEDNSSAARLSAQEPPMTFLLQKVIRNRPNTYETEIKDLVAIRQMTMQADESAQLPTGEAIELNQCNMVMEHSLGFGNESYGLLYDAKGAPVIDAIGKPAPGRFLFTHNVNWQTVPYWRTQHRPMWITPIPGSPGATGRSLAPRRS